MSNNQPGAASLRMPIPSNQRHPRLRLAAEAPAAGVFNPSAPVQGSVLAQYASAGADSSSLLNMAGLTLGGVAPLTQAPAAVPELELFGAQAEAGGSTTSNIPAHLLSLTLFESMLSESQKTMFGALKNVIDEHLRRTWGDCVIEDNAGFSASLKRLLNEPHSYFSHDILTANQRLAQTELPQILLSFDDSALINKYLGNGLKTKLNELLKKLKKEAPRNITQQELMAKIQNLSLKSTFMNDDAKEEASQNLFIVENQLRQLEDYYAIKKLVNNFDAFKSQFTTLYLALQSIVDKTLKTLEWSRTQPIKGFAHQQELEKRQALLNPSNWPPLTLGTHY